jgi:hypothetical protein
MGRWKRRHLLRHQSGIKHKCGGQAPAFRITTDDPCQASAFGNAEALGTVAPSTALSLTRFNHALKTIKTWVAYNLLKSG